LGNHSINHGDTVSNHTVVSNKQLSPIKQEDVGTTPRLTPETSWSGRDIILRRQSWVVKVCLALILLSQGYWTRFSAKHVPGSIQNVLNRQHFWQCWLPKNYSGLQWGPYNGN